MIIQIILISTTINVFPKRNQFNFSKQCYIRRLMNNKMENHALFGKKIFLNMPFIKINQLNDHIIFQQLTIFNLKNLYFIQLINNTCLQLFDQFALIIYIILSLDQILKTQNNKHLKNNLIIKIKNKRKIASFWLPSNKRAIHFHHYIIQYIYCINYLFIYCQILLIIIKFVKRICFEIFIYCEILLYDQINFFAFMQLKLNKSQSLTIKKQWFIRSKIANIYDVYKIDLKKKLLGAGKFGSVFLGQLKGTNIFRAIKKILKKDVKQDEFVNQIQILKKLDHPHIVKIYETYENSSSIYIVTELCSGGEMFDRIIQKKHFTEQEARTVFKQIMLALNYCHSQNIAHRDLKPQNFLYLSKDADSPIKLIDFGLSLGFSQEQKQKMRAFVGSYQYMAPQVMKGKYDQLCDIWSAGVILYQLVTGVRPFDGQNDEILEKVRGMKYTFDIPQMKHVSTQLKELIAKMLVVANKRPTAAQVLNDKWLVSTNINSGLKLNIKNMRTFSSYSKLKKIGVTLIASQLQQKDILGLGNLFKQIDKDNNGVLSFEQVKLALQSQNESKQTLSQLTKIINGIDSDHNGAINYTEFIASCLQQNQIAKQQNIRIAFKTLDINGDGKVSIQQLQNLLKRQQYHIKTESLNQMIKQCDYNSDGNIDYEEFLFLMTNI